MEDVIWATVPCPRCGEAISKNDIHVLSARYRDFKHDCGFEGTFIWVNPNPLPWPPPEARPAEWCVVGSHNTGMGS